MHFYTNVKHLLLDSSSHWEVSQVIGCHRFKRFPWPLCKPVDCATIHNGWEFSGSVSEGVSHWTHAQDNSKILFASFYKIFVHNFFVRIASCLLSNRSKVFKEVFHFFRRIQVGYFTTV